jgi:cyclo(L-tyrosyl-L-tyrosyl) synthase
MSPFNSYFNLEKLEYIFSWALKVFKDIHVFIPTNISSYTLQAIGYTESRAKFKTKKQDSYLINKVIRSFALGFSLRNLIKKIITMDNLDQNKNIFLFIRNVIIYLNMILLSGKDVFQQQSGCCHQKTSHSITEESLEIAVLYFLAELPVIS